MNVFAVAATGQSVGFKLLSERGVALLDYQLGRNIILLVIALIQVWNKGVNPITEFPKDRTTSLIVRCFTG